MTARVFRVAAIPVFAAVLAGCGEPAERSAPPAAPAAQPPVAANALPGRLGADLLASDERKTATFTSSNEIFAHAPTTMRAVVAQALHLRGVAGMKPQPPDQPPIGDGVEFVISKIRPDGGAEVLFATKIAPNGPPSQFDVQVEQGATLQFETKPMGDTDADWSYWGQLEAVP